MQDDLLSIYQSNLTQVEKPINGDLEITIQSHTSKKTYFFRGDYNTSVSMYWHAMSDPKVTLCEFYNSRHTL